MLNVVILKLLTLRNLIFFGVYLLFFVLIGLLISTIDQPENFGIFYTACYKFLSMWILMVVATQMSSGVWGKQLSNGQTRLELFQEISMLVGLATLIFYISTNLGFLLFLAFGLKADLVYAQLNILHLLGFAGVASFSLIIGLFIKKPLIAIVVGYFLIDLDKIPAMLLSKYVHPDLGLLFPYNTCSSFAGQISSLEIPESDFGLTLLAILFYILLFARLSFNRIQNMEFQ